MKKRIMEVLCTLIPALGISLSLCACGNVPSGDVTPVAIGSETDSGGSAFGSGSGGSTPAADSGSSTPAAGSGGSAPAASNSGGSQAGTAQGNPLSSLYNLQYKDTACVSDSGYYCLPNDCTELSDGRIASHIMYMDFATRQEIYLCSNAACAHNTADCASVLLWEDFPPHSTALFLWDDGLYIMSKAQDQDGSATMMLDASGSSVGSMAEAIPTVLYRAGLDGTGRSKVYTFDPTVAVEDFVLGDAGGLYFITKKLTTQQTGGNSYQTSSERNLVYLDLSAKTAAPVCSMDFGDNISWDVIGCSGRLLILYGIDFGRELSPEELHEDNTALYDDSYDVFATLDVDSGSLNEFYRVYAPKSRGFAVDENKLYFSVDGSGSIQSVDLRTGREATLCTIKRNLIWGRLGDKLYCCDISDHTFYFIDVNTGEISHSGLVNKTTGWALSFIAEVGGQVLVNYDSEGTFNGGGSFSPTGEHYGLIKKEDLYAGIDNFIPVGTVRY